MERIIKFKGLCCANCAEKLERKLNKMKGLEATVSFVAVKILLNLDDEILLESVVELSKKIEPEIEIIL